MTTTPHTTPVPYTPTPWRWYRNECSLGEGGAVHLLTDNDLYLEMTYNDPVIFTIRDDWIKHLQNHPEGKGNARLIIASVNSYAKHCGANAIQCAEDDLLGQALDALQECLPWLEDLNSDGYGGAGKIADEVARIFQRTVTH